MNAVIVSSGGEKAVLKQWGNRTHASILPARSWSLRRKYFSCLYRFSLRRSRVDSNTPVRLRVAQMITGDYLERGPRRYAVYPPRTANTRRPAGRSAPSNLSKCHKVHWATLSITSHQNTTHSLPRSTLLRPKINRAMSTDAEES